MNTSRRTFSLRVLLFSVTMITIGLAGFRFLVIHPAMLGAVVPLGIFLAMVISLERLQQVHSTQRRVSLGCCLLPMLFLVIGVLLSVLVTFLHGRL